MVGPWPPFKNKIKNFQETRCKKNKARQESGSVQKWRQKGSQASKHKMQTTFATKVQHIAAELTCLCFSLYELKPHCGRNGKTTHMFTMVYPWSCFLGRPKWFISSSVLANWNGIVCELPCFCFSPWELKGCCFKPCKNKASVYPWSKHLWFFVSQCQDGRTELAIIRRPMLVMFPLGPPPPCLFWYNSEWYIQPP